jgi:hypothetical protein
LDNDTSEKWKGLRLLGMQMEKLEAVCDNQLEQLKYWPAVMAPHASSYESQVDMETKTVRIIIKTGFSKAPADFKERIAATERSIKDLFGLGWGVEIERIGPFSRRKMIYRTTL